MYFLLQTSSERRHLYCPDIKDVVDEIKDINCENIYIIDDDFLVDPKRIRQFIDLIKENNILKNMYAMEEQIL